MWNAVQESSKQSVDGRRQIVASSHVIATFSLETGNV